MDRLLKFFILYMFTIIYGKSVANAKRRDTKPLPGRNPPIAPTPNKKVVSTDWYKCDFEVGYCGWKNDTSAEFEWSRISGETHTAETGPRWDHTKAGERNAGHYLYIETSVPRSNGDHARLVSPILWEQGPFCLRFWHNMHGSDVKDLNVKIKGQVSRKETTVSHLSGPWSVGSNIRNVDGEDNDWWNEESVELLVTEPIEIIFEGVRGKNYRGDIAIDDIELKKGDCPRQSASCDFEKSTCGWTQMSGDEFNWLPNRGRTQTKNTGPSHDHTSGTMRGRYLYVEASWPRVEGDKARLLSPKITCDEGATPVLNFWYNMNGKHIGPLTIFVTNDKSRFGEPVWEKIGNHGEKWLLGQVPIDESILKKGPFYIIIEAERKDYHGDTAIDDVSVAGCNAGDMRFGDLDSLTTPTTTTSLITADSTTSPRDTGVAPVLPDKMNCDFEQSGMCAWRQDRNDEFDWERHRGTTHSHQTGPSVDHTIGSKSGWYLYTEASSPRKKYDKAVIRSPAINSAISTCVSFYYHMEGTQMGKLELLTFGRGGFRSTRQWMKQGQQSTNSTDWKLAKVSVREREPYEIAFRATLGKGFYSDIAIDDIKVDPFPCSDVPASKSTLADSQMTTTATTEPQLHSLACQFKGDTCLWTQLTSPNDEFDWTIPNGKHSRSEKTGPFHDHTSGSSDEYIYIEASSPRYMGDRAHLKSPLWKVEKPMCFQFWYHMLGQATGNLTVYMVKDTILKPIWSTGGNKGDVWIQANVDIRKKGDMSLIVEAKRGESWSGDIALDDFNVVEGECPHVDCDFEIDNCAWEQNDKHDQFDWTRNSGDTKSKNTGPSTDHTIKNDNGTYLYIEASNPRQRFDKARIISPIIDPKFHPAKCLTFWYHSFGEHVGSINVYKKPANSNDTYFGSPSWENTGNEGNQWVFAKININDELAYQIVIEGVVGLDYHGDIAFDDIALLDGPCDPCCSDNQFLCGNNFCINEVERCNRIDDCGDNSDENFCKDGPPCGSPYSTPPIREVLELPENIRRDEASAFQSIEVPEEGADPPSTPNNTRIGALKIPDKQTLLLKYPKFISHSTMPLNVGYYAGDMPFHLLGVQSAETFQSEQRKKRSAEEFGEGFSNDDDWIDLLKIQKIQKQNRGDSVSAEFLHRSLKIRQSLGEKHKLSRNEWARQRPLQSKKLKVSRVKRGIKKIVGGTKTTQYNYPWQAAYYITDTGTKSHYFCGATLIKRYWLLTAAHCPYLGDLHNIVLGDYDLYTDEGTEQEMIVDAIFLRNEYRADRDLVGDIALIKLRYPAKQSKSVQLACLLPNSAKPFDAGHICVTTGWGRTKADTPGIERFLRQAEMPIISKDQCKRAFWSVYTIHDSYVCAGGTGGNSCRGDSGGPLMCKRNDQFYLTGITSWGDTKCKSNIPGVFTRVQSYNKWMNRIMKKHGGCHAT